MKVVRVLIIMISLILFGVSTLDLKSQNIGINSTGSTPNVSAGLDVDFFNKGFLLPRMTTAQRNTITSPALSLLIFNITDNCLQIRNTLTGQWENVYCFSGCTGIPSQPSVIIGATPVTQGDNGVVYSVANIAGINYTWSYSGTGFTCVSGCTTNSITANFSTTATSGILTVTPINGCGNGTSRTFSITVNNPPPFVCGVSTVTFIYRGSSVTYGTVNSAGGRCWLDRNLGASQVATSSSDASAYGDLFQWGRLSDDHQDRTSTTTTTLSPTDVPANGLWINSVSFGLPFNWRSSQNDNLWQGVGGVNKPCPNGYRLPTQSELITESSSWGAGNGVVKAFSSPLKLTAGGIRQHDGSLFGAVNAGYYWASTPNAVDERSFHLFFRASPSAVIVGTAQRGLGMSVRCIKD